MKALKSLVIGMGVLIVAGLGVIAVTLYNRGAEWESPRQDGPEKTAGAAIGKAADAAGGKAAGAPLPAFGTVRLGLPAGGAVLGMTAGGGRLLLRARHPDGGEWIYVVDLATGATLGRIEVTPGK